MKMYGTAERFSVIKMAIPNFVPGTQIRASEMNQAFQAVMNIMYPVGSVFTSTNNTAVDELPGEWDLLTDDQIVAYAALSSATTISEAKNITSVTKNGGMFRVNFSKPMADTNYKAFVSGEVGGAAAEIIGVFSKDVNGFYYDFYNREGVPNDPLQVNILVVGKLATPEKYVYKRIS